MTSAAPPCYSTAVFSYTPHVANNGDPQAVQAALSAVAQRIRQETERRGREAESQPTSSRWFVQIRMLRLAVPGAAGSTTRSMYMLRNPAVPEIVTLVIEDTARSAVNISTVAAGPFDYFMQTSLLQQASKADQQQGASTNAQQDRTAQQNQATQAGRWIPRPSYVQIEGITVHDPSTDFKVSVGMLNARGGASGASSSTSSNLIVQVEYLPTPTLPATSSHILQQYLAQLLPEHGSLTDLSLNTSQLDWRGILGVGPDEQGLPEWSMRNTGWFPVVVLFLILDDMADEAYPPDKPEAIRIYISNPSLLLIPACAASFGFVSGLLTAGQRASLQFLAENAHRQPTTLQGWYFYNKTKNYRVALASVKGALATAGRMGGWTGAFVGLQEGFKRVTGWQEAQSGAASGTVLALAATTLYRLPRRALPRYIFLGLSLGALAGGLQDIRDWAKMKKQEALLSG